jgi:hypothetical protein
MIFLDLNGGYFGGLSGNGGKSCYSAADGRVV